MTLRCSALIPAPAALVFAAACDLDSFRAARVRIDRRGLLADGDTMRIGTVGPVQAEVAPGSIVLRGRRFRYEQELIAVADGTLLVQEVRGRGVDRAQLRRRAEWIRRRAWYEVPVIVAAAVLEGGRLLAAQRTYPPSAAGRYELPGGKVEAGESPRSALLREWQEELGVGILTGPRIGGDIMIGRYVLRVWQARIRRGVPEPREHAQLRWVDAGELADLDWLPADRALLPDLRVLLRA